MSLKKFFSTFGFIFVAVQLGSPLVHAAADPSLVSLKDFAEKANNPEQVYKALKTLVELSQILCSKPLPRTGIRSIINYVSTNTTPSCSDDDFKAIQDTMRTLESHFTPADDDSEHSIDQQILQNMQEPFEFSNGLTKYNTQEKLENFLTQTKAAWKDAQIIHINESKEDMYVFEKFYELKDLMTRLESQETHHTPLTSDEDYQDYLKPIIETLRKQIYSDDTPILPFTENASLDTLKHAVNDLAKVSQLLINRKFSDLRESIINEEEIESLEVLSKELESFANLFKNEQAAESEIRVTALLLKERAKALLDKNKNILIRSRYNALIVLANELIPAAPAAPKPAVATPPTVTATPPAATAAPVTPSSSTPAATAAPSTTATTKPNPAVTTATSTPLRTVPFIEPQVHRKHNRDVNDAQAPQTVEEARKIVESCRLPADAQDAKEALELLRAVQDIEGNMSKSEIDRHEKRINELFLRGLEGDMRRASVDDLEALRDEVAQFIEDLGNESSAKASRTGRSRDRVGQPLIREKAFKVLEDIAEKFYAHKDYEEADATLATALSLNPSAAHEKILRHSVKKLEIIKLGDYGRQIGADGTFNLEVSNLITKLQREAMSSCNQNSRFQVYGFGRASTSSSVNMEECTRAQQLVQMAANLRTEVGSNVRLHNPQNAIINPLLMNNGMPGIMGGGMYGMGMPSMMGGGMFGMGMPGMMGGGMFGMGMPSMMGGGMMNGGMMSPLFRY